MYKIIKYIFVITLVSIFIFLIKKFNENDEVTSKIHKSNTSKSELGINFKKVSSIPEVKMQPISNPKTILNKNEIIENSIVKNPAKHIDKAEFPETRSELIPLKFYRRGESIDLQIAELRPGSKYYLGEEKLGWIEHNIGPVSDPKVSSLINIRRILIKYNVASNHKIDRLFAKFFEGQIDEDRLVHSLTKTGDKELIKPVLNYGLKIVRAIKE